MYCPSCFNKSENPEHCSYCSFDLKPIKELHSLSCGQFKRAITDFKAGNLQECSDSCTFALSIYPFNLDLLKFSILVFIDSGNYIQAKDAIEILIKLNPDLANKFEIELISVIKRYNCLLRYAKDGRLSELTEHYKDNPELTTFEKNLFDIINNPGTENYVQPEHNINRRFSDGFSFNRIIAIAGLIVLLLSAIFVYHRKEKVINESQEKYSVLYKDSLNKLITINNKLTELTNSNFNGNKDKFLFLYLSLQKLDPNLDVKLDKNLKSKLAYDFYASGRRAYLIGIYNNASDYFNTSYKLVQDTWFSDDALYYHAICLKFQKDLHYKTILNELIKKYNSSLYIKEAERILSQNQ
jgi:hypothetical protein